MELQARPCLRFIGGLIILTTILSFFYGSNYENIKREYLHGFYDGKNGICSTDEVITVKDNSLNIDAFSSSLNKIDLATKTKNINIEIKGPNIYYKTSFFAYFLMFMYITLYIIMFISFIYFLKRLMKGKIFEKSTYNSLNMLGISMIVLPFVEYFYNYFIWISKSKTLKTINLELVNTNDFNSYLLIAGLFMIAFGISFRLGINIKEENDLTV